MNIKNIIVEKLILIEPEIELIYLFGSMASNTNKAQSDVDVAFFSQKKIDNVQRWEIAQSLALVLNMDVDLVNLDECSTVMRFQVVTEGMVLYDKFDKADMFDTTTISMYQHLQEARKPMIDDYMERMSHAKR
ncbi:type VII toxin-antitoxin system MntA family adenylyltransferase antitoxin [Marinicellulosiphila megalodicopiae]|uniref:type VII toxin-antitoxin system MntA family adenylyltransferase antitoxin n=1 Tax=Marinicellulosiphila megalodicopiae TaxID=2724896 RepID=UPI003BB1BD6B